MPPILRFECHHSMFPNDRPHRPEDVYIHSEIIATVLDGLLITWKSNFFTCFQIFMRMKGTCKILSVMTPKNNGSCAYLDVFHLLIHEHDFDQEVFGVWGDRLLADVLYQLTELHRHPLSTLKRFT